MDLVRAEQNDPAFDVAQFMAPMLLRAEIAKLKAEKIARQTDTKETSGLPEGQ